MRGRIALQKHCVRKLFRALFPFREARPGRVRPTGGLLECALPARRVPESTRRFIVL